MARRAPNQLRGFKSYRVSSTSLAATTLPSCCHHRWFCAQSGSLCSSSCWMIFWLAVPPTDVTLDEGPITRRCWRTVAFLAVHSSVPGQCRLQGSKWSRENLRYHMLAYRLLAVINSRDLFQLQWPNTSPAYGYILPTRMYFSRRGK